MLVTTYDREYEVDVWEGPDGFNWAVARGDEVITIGCESNRRNAEWAAREAIRDARSKAEGQQ